MIEEMNEQQISLKEYIRILLRGKWVIAISFLVVMTATVFWTWNTHPVYEAVGLILLKQESMQQQIFDVPTFMKKETMINNHVEILQSDTVAKDVIKSLMASPYADSLYVLGSRKLEERLGIVRWLKNLMPQDEVDKQGPPSVAELAEGLKKGAFSVVPRRDTDLVECHVTALSPFEAKFITNTWMESYKDMDIDLSSGEVSQVRLFLEGKLIEVKAELDEAENELKKYMEDKNVAELGSETEQLIQQSAQFEGLYQEAKTELEANQRRLDHMKAQLDESQRSLVDKATALSSPVIQQLQQQMATEMAKKAAYEQQLRSADLYSPDNPQLQQMESRLKGLQASISQEMEKMVASGAGGMNPLEVSQSLLNSIIQIEAENHSLRARTNELRKIVRQYDRSLDDLPSTSLRMARLKRDQQVKNNLYIMLTEKYEENRIAEAGQIGSVRIIDKAQIPKFPIKPNKRMNLMLGFILGIGLGVGIVFLKEYLDTSLKTIEDVERMGFAVLGSIPFISPQRISKNGDGKNGNANVIESRLVTHFAPKSPISESYRTLRTNIQYAQVDNPIKSVVVTSSGPGEGKSTSVANLAITFAQMGAKTLLVDTDLRRPVLHGIFGHTRNEGLTNVLVGRMALDNAIKPTRIDDLDLVTSGTLPPNPSELLNSHMMEKFLTDVKQKYDIVLLDTPPVIAVTDAAVLSTKVDGVVLIMRSGNTARDVLDRSTSLLNKVNAKLLGILVNGVNTSEMYGSYYQYYEYYYSHDSKDKKRGKKRSRVRG